MLKSLRRMGRDEIERNTVTMVKLLRQLTVNRRLKDEGNKYEEDMALTLNVSFQIAGKGF